VNGNKKNLGKLVRKVKDGITSDLSDRLRKTEITAHDLFMLCRRAEYAISRGRHADAAEILSHATRIAARIGIEDKPIRTLKSGD
jgi:hypothetical protein